MTNFIDRAFAAIRSHAPASAVSRPVTNYDAIIDETLASHAKALDAARARGQVETFDEMDLSMDGFSDAQVRALITKAGTP